MKSPIGLLLRLLDRAFNKKSWHGTNLRGAIRGLDPFTISFRPQPGRHNIWEIIVHAAYWKYVVRRRLLSEKKGSFPLKGSNWFERPGAAVWRDDVHLLEATHRSLRQAVAGLRPADLQTSPGGSISNLDLIHGIAAHDLYHAGQVQILKRLAADAAQSAKPAHPDGL